MKTFEGPYTNYDGTMENKSYTVYVRDIERGMETYCNPAGELMWENGLYSGCRPKQDCGLRVIDANKMFEFLSDIIISGKAEGLLYTIAKRWQNARSREKMSLILEFNGGLVKTTLAITIAARLQLSQVESLRTSSPSPFQFTLTGSTS